MQQSIVIFWFRRDIRLIDNRGLSEALRSGKPVLPVFIFDKNILGRLPANDQRVPFIYGALELMQQQLTELGSTLYALYATPEEAFEKLLSNYSVDAVYTNSDYEPYARQRDEAIEGMLKKKGIHFYSYKDTVLFEKSEVIKDNGQPYQVYTPFYKKWRSLLKPEHLKSSGSEKFLPYFYKQPSLAIPSMSEMGFNAKASDFTPSWPAPSLIKHYHETRNLPAVAGTTRLGPHLRFGTISIRQLAREGDALNETFLKELCWREFFMQILWHFPKPGHAFKPEYDNIEWRHDEAGFEAWCAGRTGYGLVDAGMRELNATGFMHNRVRMVTASFLVKHLLVDWRWGEAYFAAKLMDFELAANNGNWQWVAGSGCDAAPYFRIFNPILQAQRFDPKEEYIRKWVPEYKTADYVLPIVDHKTATARCIAVYKKALNRDQLSLFP